MTGKGKSSIEVILYEEVAIRVTNFDNGLTSQSSQEASEERAKEGGLLLRKREYRTARHKALIETQIFRRSI